MSIVAADSAMLALNGVAIAGVAKRTLSLSRSLADSTHAGSSGWQDQSALQAAARGELRVQGVFVSGAAMAGAREAFLGGEAEAWSLELPSDGTWSGQFLIRQFDLIGEAETELTFSLRLTSTGPLQFQPEA